jgi:hypothetical protein
VLKKNGQNYFSEDEILAFFQSIKRVKSIRDMEDFLNSIWDWTIFNGCFKYNISPMDIDALVERNGRVLFFEFKGSKHIANSFSGLSKGPNTTFRKLVYYGFTGVFVKGCADTKFIEKLVVYWRDGMKLKETEIPEPETTHLKNLAKDWFL